jgi:hypothetical protein
MTVVNVYMSISYTGLKNLFFLKTEDYLCAIPKHNSNNIRSP